MSRVRDIHQSEPRGDSVKPEREISRRELEVEIENTESLVKLAEQQLELEENNYRRQRSAHAGGAGSDSELDAAAQSKLQAQNGLATLSSQLRLLKERLNRVEAEREHASLRMEKADLDRQRAELATLNDELEFLKKQREDVVAFIGQIQAVMRDKQTVQVDIVRPATEPEEPDLTMHLWLTLAALAPPVVFALVLLPVRLLAAPRA